MHGGRVWLIPQFNPGDGVGWQPIMRGGVFASDRHECAYDVTDPNDAAGRIEKALQDIERHKNNYQAEETVIWPTEGVTDLIDTPRTWHDGR